MFKIQVGSINSSYRFNWTHHRFCINIWSKTIPCGRYLVPLLLHPWYTLLYIRQSPFISWILLVRNSIIKIIGLYFDRVMLPSQIVNLDRKAPSFKSAPRVPIRPLNAWLAKDWSSTISTFVPFLEMRINVCFLSSSSNQEALWYFSELV